MWWDRVVFGSEVSLQRISSSLQPSDFMLHYLDDRDNVGRSLFKFGQVDIKMGQLIFLGFFMNETGPVSDSMDAS